MNDLLGALIITAIIGFAIFGVLAAVTNTFPSELIQICEKELPRNKHCKLIAIVDE
jgi:hypothetical protein